MHTSQGFVLNSTLFSTFYQEFWNFMKLSFSLMATLLTSFWKFSIYFWLKSSTFFPTVKASTPVTFPLNFWNVIIKIFFLYLSHFSSGWLQLSATFSRASLIGVTVQNILRPNVATEKPAKGSFGWCRCTIFIQCTKQKLRHYQQASSKLPIQNVKKSF